MAAMAEVKAAVWLLILTCPISAVSAICQRECRPYPTPEKYVELKCRGNSDMFFVDVRSPVTTNGACSGSSTCSGLQQEVLRVVAEDCYWHSRCYIPLNNSYPNILNIDGMCISVIPSVMETRALCLKRNKIYNFYTMEPQVSKKRKEGVIKINDIFPWDYSTGTPYRRITFKAKTGKKLRISFLVVDYDDTVDVLKLKDGQREINVSEANKNENFDFTSGDVTMEFFVAGTSRRGKGFVLCFYRLRLSDNRPKHACDLVKGVKCLPGKTKDRRGGRQSGNSQSGGRRRGSRRRSPT